MQTVHAIEDVRHRIGTVGNPHQRIFIGRTGVTDGNTDAMAGSVAGQSPVRIHFRRQRHNFNHALRGFLIFLELFYIRSHDKLFRLRAFIFCV